jgi:L-amino acid N-acyltransferase YncA
MSSGSLYGGPVVDDALLLRPLERRDAEATRRIYNHAVLTSTATLDIEPRTPSEHARWVDEHLGVYACLVAEVHGEVVGFASLSPFRPRAGYASTVEDSIYLDPSVHGQGIGTRLLVALLATAKELGFHACMAHIVADHHVSRTLHSRAGFELVGIQREVARKFSRWIDIAIMERLL